MGNGKKYHLKVIVVLFLCLGLTQCFKMSESNAVVEEGNEVDTVDSEEIIGLTEIESNAYETGPADIPVSIAKLDALDSDYVKVEYRSSQENTGSSFLSTEYLRTDGTSCSTGHYFVTLRVGATIYPFVYAYNINTGDEVVVEVSQDVETGFCVPATEGDYFALAPMDELQQYIGMPLILAHENGVTTATTTNTASLATSSIPTFIDNSMYLTLFDNSASNSENAYLADAGKNYAAFTYSLHRRNLGESGLETVAEYLVAPITNMKIYNDAVYFLDVTNRLQKIEFTTDDAGLTVWNPPEEIDNTGFASAETYGHYVLRVFVSSNGHVFLTNDYTEQEMDKKGEGYFVAKVFTNSGETVIHDKMDYVEADFVQSRDDLLFAFLRKAGSNNYSVYSLDMTKGGEAWDNKTLIYEYQPQFAGNRNFLTAGRRIIDANPSSYVLIDLNTNSVTQLISNNGTMSTLPGYILSPNAALSPSGEYLAIAMNTPYYDGSEGNPGLIVLHRIGVDAINTFYLIPRTDIDGATEWALGFDEINRLIYYNYDLSKEKPQLTHVDPANINYQKLPLITVTAP